MITKFQIKLSENQLTELRRENIEKQNQVSKVKEVKENYIKVLTKNYDLKKENWGYDPITGEIKDE